MFTIHALFVAYDLCAKGLYSICVAVLSIYHIAYSDYATREGTDLHVNRLFKKNYSSFRAIGAFTPNVPFILLFGDFLFFF